MLNDNILDMRLLEQKRTIIRFGNYINIYTKISWKCLMCNNVWESTPDSVINKCSGCPKCSDRKLTNEYVDGQLKINSRKIKRLDDYINNNSVKKWLCEICGKIWKARTRDILNKKSGCPDCAHKTLNNEKIDKYLEGSDIIRLEDFKGNTKKKILFGHTICGFEWESTTAHIIYNKVGCPKCSKSGKDEKLIYDIFIKNNISFEYQKKLQNINSQYPNYILDYYIDYANLIIEYNGRQHYGPVRFGGISEEKAQQKFDNQVKRDNELNNICKCDGINIIWINSKDYTGKS